jgi:hypothetical protein
MRMAVVGHAIWFANHYPENWRDDPEVMCPEVSEADYSWLTVLGNWRPDVTLFYRPELYPEHLVQQVGGLRIAFLTEPLPALRKNKLATTPESALRLRVYEKMAWDAFHRRLYYDQGRAETVGFLRWPIDGYRPMPIDTASFHPSQPGAKRPVDVCFVGKATPYRIGRLEPLRSMSLRAPGTEFVWVAHGLYGVRLADLFRRSKVVLNVHADGVPAQEPRLYLAAACGCRVVSEPLPGAPAALRRWIVEEPREWTIKVMQEHIGAWADQGWSSTDEAERVSLSVRRLLTSEYEEFSRRPG